MKTSIQSCCWTTQRSTLFVESDGASLSAARSKGRRTIVLVHLVAMAGLGLCAFGHDDEKNAVLLNANAPETTEVGPWEGDLILDFELPQSKRQEFETGCVEGHIALGFSTVVGCRVWYVPKDDWPQAHRLAQRLQIPTITPVAGIPVGQSICFVSTPAFQAGDWDTAFDAALDAIRHTDSESHQPEDLTRELTPQERSLPDLRHTLQECHLRSVNEAKGLRLPTIQEWMQLKQSLSRTDQIVYLGDRISLSKGVVNENELVVPRSIQRVARRRKLVPPMPEMSRGDDLTIDPFEELLKLNILPTEVTQLYRYFAVNWTFLSEGDATAANLPLHAGSRYCLCVVINQVFKRRNAIREYDLTHDDWQDVEKIALLVQRKCIDPVVDVE